MSIDGGNPILESGRSEPVKMLVASEMVTMEDGCERCWSDLEWRRGIGGLTPSVLCGGYP